MATRGGKVRGRLGRPLELALLSGFPLRQEIVLRPDPGRRAEAITPAVLEHAGFTAIDGTGLERTLGPSGARYSLMWVGERGLRRRGVTASTAVVPIIVVFLAGAILGGLDAYILASPIVGIFWVLGAAATSGVFWLLYGGTYDSDLVLLTVAHPDTPSVPSAGGASIVLWAARVRSHVQADLRVPEVVTAPLKLAAEVGSLSREFIQRLSHPSPEPPSAAVGG